MSSLRQFLLTIAAIYVGMLLVAATWSLWDVSKGGTGIRTAAEDTAIMGGGGSAALIPTAVPNCATSLRYSTSTHLFTCAP